VWRRLGELLTAVVTAVLVFAAVPTCLVVAVGDPLPLRWHHSTIVSATGLFDLLAIVAWVAWLACAWPLLRSVAHRVRQRDGAVVAGARLPERLAARIAAGILFFFPSAGLLSGVAAASGARTTPVAVVAAASPRLAASADRFVRPAPPAPVRPVAAGGAPLATTLYTVVAGDSLWSIAEHFYDSGHEWEAIAAANFDRLMPDGQRLLDPSLILPGWVLVLPDPLAPEDAPLVTSVPPHPSDQSTAQLAGLAVRATPDEVLTTAGHLPRGRTVHHAPAAPRPVPGLPTPPAPTAPSRRTPVPELSALGLGVLGAGALTRRLGRLRMAARAETSGSGGADAHSEEAIDTATLLDHFRLTPLLQWFELANRALTVGLLDSRQRARTPRIRAVRVGPDGCEFVLADAVTWAPPGFTSLSPRSWHLPTTADPAELTKRLGGCQPWLPAVLAVGDDDRGTWLVPAERGCCIPVIGYGAEGLLRTMALVAGCWDWSSAVVVTEDVAEAERATQLLGEDDDHERRRVLFFGDPRRLSPAARSRGGSVTALPLPPTDVTIAVDARSATIHPLGVTVETNALHHDYELAVNRLLLPTAPTSPQSMTPLEAPGDDGAPPLVPRGHGDLALNDAAASRPTTFHRQTADHLVGEPVLRSEASVLDALGLEPGPVEVRLLTSLPRLDGLAEPIDPKRARRATELVAYLALHQPDQVTSERLRNRVLGSADTDAAAKTLFNTVGAARRAMGLDPAGTPLLPTASRSGHYRVSAQVTSDVDRVTRLVRASAAASDRQVAMACARAALSLVEGEPLGGLLAGYSWWRTEGHEARVANVLVEAAVRLARLASEDGRGPLAHWAVEQARLVDPYSETLVRAAMEAAAVLGDRDRLRREWLDCQRRVNEIDPGGYPSASTELLYSTLSRQLAADVVRPVSPVEESPSAIQL